MIAKLLKERPIVAPRDAYNDTLNRMMDEDDRIVQLEADLSGAMGSGKIKAKHPDRFVNCGIMEGHMMGLASGLSINGMIPFAHTFAAFATRRAMDQVFMSGCYAGANVKIIGSDPGLYSESNGGTHQCFEDISAVRCMAGMTVMDVADPVLLAKVLPQMKDAYGMMYLRTARKIARAYYDQDNEFEIGKGKLLRDGSDVTIIACGACVAEALDAADMLAKEGIEVRVVDMFTIKPIDAELVVESAKKTGCIVTAENHNIHGGLGSAVAEVLSEQCPTHMVRVGVQERFGEVGEAAYLIKALKLDGESIAEACKKAIAKKG